ncbi:LysM peptidoglycan-binding domain-containing protein, partial [Luteibacter sp.]|uniref:LysM peptidoglycan-binding domain-containing protein n=1 Tax=Luteibacter sp. TaxID=1886636 RepID=UPI003F806F1F
ATSAALASGGANGPNGPGPQYQYGSGSSAKSSGGAKSYTVRKGDTLVSIARKSSCADVEDIAKMNGLKGHALKVGQALKVPVCR